MEWNYFWGKLIFLSEQFDAASKKVLMVDLFERVMDDVVLHEIKGISRCFPQPNESENDKSVKIGTEGCNIRGKRLINWRYLWLFGWNWCQLYLHKRYLGHLKDFWSGGGSFCNYQRNFGCFRCIRHRCRSSSFGFDCRFHDFWRRLQAFQSNGHGQQSFSIYPNVVWKNDAFSYDIDAVSI